MSRLRETMSRLAAEGRAALIAYVTAGDPSPGESVAIVEAATAAGADIIELGVPFSDPNADGVVIQQAMQRARAAGAGLESSLQAVAELRRRGCAVPVVLFGYYNPIFVYGNARFAAAAAEVGIDAVLTVDLPLEELDELRAPLLATGVDVVPLLAPTSDASRLAQVGELTPPFVYYISMTGVTGAAFAGASVGRDRVAEVRVATGAPVAVGFGIKSADDAAQVASYADGVVVGTAIVRAIAAAGPGGAAAAVAELVADLRRGVDGASR